jgi:class I fructose-bisphosphate aldolase
MLTLTVAAPLAPLITTGPDTGDGRPGRTVQLEGGDWAAATAEIRTRFPRLAERVLTDTGGVRPGFLLVVNDTVAGSPEAPQVKAGDEVFLLVQVAGGAAGGPADPERRAATVASHHPTAHVSSTGKRVRLHRMLFGHGPGNGRCLFLPYDHGLEHGPRDFAGNPDAADPAYVVKLAVDGGFSGIALQIGTARQFFWDFAGEVPLILKLNGKTDIPPDDEALSPVHASVEEAVQLGADAVGYTLYVGSPRQVDDLVQLRTVRQDAERLGMPLIIWAYPRGSAIRARGGRDSFYAVDYAARVAAELGADLVKVNWPDRTARSGVPPAYDREVTPAEMLQAVVGSAGRSLVLLSGGERADDDQTFGRVQEALAAGVTGLIFGRNVWQRSRDEALRFAARLHDVLAAR